MEGFEERFDFGGDIAVSSAGSTAMEVEALAR